MITAKEKQLKKDLIIKKAHIELIVLDIDGTLTDGKVYYLEGTKQDSMKCFDVKDGLGIVKWLKIAKKELALISGRKSKSSEFRASELGIKYVYTGIQDKAKCLETLISKLKLIPQNVAVMGDDENDLNMFKMAGLSYAPKDAYKSVVKAADVVVSKKGGEGAVREMIEDLLKVRNSFNYTKDSI
ncbi:hypothetical protein BKH43_07535 [Helicobacter sp. 13S00401-1]|uniref:KdsC family phosphatase n=1 Tax=Helicobacter sp. 13S00401-1 TaxID=1905758 RepID=UPI000BA783E0|nr:HAD hydrolase family protein [Helicobacter sp. 13S00401-1]PAF49004.1 hypothetical protein BKH43_07535 [Helicobacter sp. 13S00401-1]